MDLPKRRLRDHTSLRTTLVSEGCTINGVINGDGDFLLNGEIEGNCDIKGVVTVAQTGHWAGTINATDVIVAGRVEGDIIASNRVEIGETANINGTVSAAHIAVAEGAIVEGAITTTGQDKPTSFLEKRSVSDDFTSGK